MKILLAEDDEPVRNLLTDFLTDMGHEVMSVENGQELVKLALESRPDLVVTDMHMPEMTGDSMIAMIDMYPPLAGIPVIMVTGASKMELADAGIPVEIPIILKPVDFEKLTAEINKVAEKLGGV
ncbi:MAG: response regulator [Elusimicrobia bacterium]|nr:response regulator [Elusimicrobiota bacterium]